MLRQGPLIFNLIVIPLCHAPLATCIRQPYNIQILLLDCVKINYHYCFYLIHHFYEYKIQLFSEQRKPIILELISIPTNDNFKYLPTVATEYIRLREDKVAHKLFLRFIINPANND